MHYNSEAVAVLIDSGALVSVIPLSVIKGVGLEIRIKSTKRRLRFGGGQIERAAGYIEDVRLILSEDLVVEHQFLVTENPFTPMILGIDFLYQAYAVLGPREMLVKFKLPDLKKSRKFQHIGDLDCILKRYLRTVRHKWCYRLQ